MNNEAIVATFIYVSRISRISLRNHRIANTSSIMIVRTSLSQRYPSAMPSTHPNTIDKEMNTACTTSMESTRTCSVHLLCTLAYSCLRHAKRRDARCVQEVGKMVTKQDRCIAFPNIYQHLVSPFRLADTTKPGHRKILVFFLVDPSIRIPSASDVAPQQMSWFRRAVSGTVLWDRLPTELQDVIIAHTGLMTEEEANAYRLDLMQERTAFVDVVDKQRFGTEFNMWYVLSRK